ncbi:MAG: hypothetical protein Q8Q50_04495 [Methylobacter sp.]|jgi:hypothetical protein|nr:hypothetical protein [Methylobacter sp.]
MHFIRQIYDDLPDFIPIPAELKHSKAEVIILPLEPQATRNESGFKAMLVELAAINELEPVQMECPNRDDRINPFLNEDL